MDDDELLVRVHGFAAATASIDRERWERMGRMERKKWARDELKRLGSVTDVASVLAEGPGGEVADDLEW